MPTTPTLLLPYPAPGDPADVPTDMNELATRIETVRGAANGLASLDATGKVPAAQLAAGLAKIQDTLLASPAATIDFPGIPGSYSHLRLHLVGRTDVGSGFANAVLRFNGDATALYSSEQVLNTAATTAGAQEQASSTSITIATLTGASHVTGYVGSAVIDIPNYTGTAWVKVVNGVSGYTTTIATGGTVTKSQFGVWANTAAITRITLSLSSGNFVVGTRATLYGLN
jgi:hypothetical protein